MSGSAGVTLVGDTLTVTRENNNRSNGAGSSSGNASTPLNNANNNKNGFAVGAYPSSSGTDGPGNGNAKGGGGGGGGGGGESRNSDVLVLPRFKKNQRRFDPTDHSWCCDAQPEASFSHVPIIGGSHHSRCPSQLIPNSIGVIGAAGNNVGGRDHMEDRHRIMYNNNRDLLYTAFAGVYDGHGGEETAHYASKHLHRIIQDVALTYAKQRRIDVSPIAPNCSAAKLDALDYQQSANKPPTPTTLTANAPSASSSVTSSPASSASSTSLLDYKTILMSAFDKLEADALKLSTEIGSRDGCTSTCVLIAGDAYYCANTGDSRTVLCRDGNAVPLSVDHKPYSPSERARIEAAGGSVEPVMVERAAFCCLKAKKIPQGADRLWPGGFSVSRAIGDIDYKDLRRKKSKVVNVLIHVPEVTITSASPDDQFIILGSDGLWDVMTNQAACDFVVKEMKKKDFRPHTTAQRLADKAFAMGSEDNITAVIMFFTPKTAS